MQQQSEASGQIDTYNEDLDYLFKYVKDAATNPEVKFAWHMTWAYQSDISGKPVFKEVYNNNQMKMYTMIVDAVKTKILSNDNFSYIIPIGTAIQNVRSSYIRDTLTRDGYHLSNELGRYIASMAWAKTLLGLPIENVRFPNVYQEAMPVFIEAVNNADTNPWKVTKSTVADPGKLFTTRVMFRNSYLKFDVQPEIMNDRVMVPFRNVFAAFGAEIDWDETTSTATALKDAVIIKITQDGENAYINEVPTKLDAPATIIDGRFLVPLRFVSEAFGALVYWHEPDGVVVIIEKSDFENPAPMESEIPIVDCSFSNFFEDEIGHMSYDGNPTTLWS